MKVRIERLGKFRQHVYVDVWHAGEWWGWNDEPLNRRQARALVQMLQAERPGMGPGGIEPD